MDKHLEVESKADMSEEAAWLRSSGVQCVATDAVAFAHEGATERSATRFAQAQPIGGRQPATSPPSLVPSIAAAHRAGIPSVAVVNFGRVSCATLPILPLAACLLASPTTTAFAPSSRARTPRPLPMAPLTRAHIPLLAAGTSCMRTRPNWWSRPGVPTTSWPPG